MMTEGPYVELDKYVKDAGKVLEIMPNLLKVRHPKSSGGETIYSVHLVSHSSKHLNDSAAVALRSLTGKL